MCETTQRLLPHCLVHTLLMTTVNEDTLSQNVMLCEIMFDIFLFYWFKIVMQLQVYFKLLQVRRFLCPDNFLYFVIGLKSSEYILRGDWWYMDCL